MSLVQSVQAKNQDIGTTLAAAGGQCSDTEISRLFAQDVMSAESFLIGRSTLRIIPTENLRIKAAF